MELKYNSLNFTFYQDFRQLFIATPAIIQKTSMKFLLFAVLLFIHAELQHCGKKYLVQTEGTFNIDFEHW